MALPWRWQARARRAAGVLQGAVGGDRPLCWAPTLGAASADRRMDRRMNRPLIIHLVDDDAEILEVLSAALRDMGHAVTISRTGAQGLEAIRRSRPDLVILDLMMPEMDGTEVCRRLRADPALADLKIIMLSAKIYPADRVAAMAAGADAYAIKPILIKQLEDLIARVVLDEIEVFFWGVRGTLPAPGPRNMKYGGNTSCVQHTFPRGELFLLDAGSGIREAGMRLMSQKRGRIKGTILITHPHWDHINALPFFTPLYVQGNEITIGGPAQQGATMRDLVGAQMDGRFFPITPGEFGASIHYTDLYQDRYLLQGIEVQTMLLMHPGTCLGYRFNYHGRSVCYVTDNELYLAGSVHHGEEYLERLSEFVAGTDLLITDTTYTDAEYPSRVGWGHASVSEVARLAHKADVKRLAIFHHDPSQTDDDIDRKHADTIDALARFGSRVECLAPKERDELRV